MTRRRYIVVHGVSSACGLHPGSKSWRECPHCARANAANEAALADVVTRTGGGTRVDMWLRDADVTRIQQAHRDGASVNQLTVAEKRSRETIVAAIEGTYTTVEGRKRIAEYRMPMPGQHARSAATPLARGVR